MKGMISVPTRDNVAILRLNRQKHSEQKLSWRLNWNKRVHLSVPISLCTFCVGHRCSSMVICAVILKVRVFHVVEIAPAEICFNVYRSLKYICDGQ